MSEDASVILLCSLVNQPTKTKQTSKQTKLLFIFLNQHKKALLEKTRKKKKVSIRVTANSYFENKVMKNRVCKIFCYRQDNTQICLHELRFLYKQYDSN